MLSGLFNYDNPVWRFIGKFWDVLIVNLLWIVCSIPIVTIGASTTAMYYVTLRLARDDDGYTFRSFFKSFRENFKQATAIWLIFLTVGLLLACDVYYFVRLVGASTMRTVMITIFFSMVFIWVAMFTYVFPLQARFYNPVKRTIFNAFYGNPPCVQHHRDAGGGRGYRISCPQFPSPAYHFWGGFDRVFQLLSV